MITDPRARTRRATLVVTGRDGHPERLWIEGDEADPNLLAVDRHGIYEAHLVELFQRVLPSDAVVVDAGANLGFHTLALARLVPEGRVVAFEPAGRTAEHLRRNATVAENVTVVVRALGARTGPATLSMNPAAPGGAFISEHLVLHSSEEVETVRLDDWAHGFDRLDLVKLDVEGGELDALAGAEQTLDRFGPDLVVEYNPMALRRGGRAPGALFDSLARRFPWVSVVGRGARLVPVRSWGQLRALLLDRGVVDLFCSQGAPRLGERLRATTLRGGSERPGRRPPDRRYLFEAAVHIEPDCDALEVPRGAEVEVGGLLENRSRQWLSPHYVNGAVVLAGHWRSVAGEFVEFEGRRHPLPHPFAPGETARAVWTATAPRVPGDYLLELTVLQEEVAWFDLLDPANAASVPVRVT